MPIRSDLTSHAIARRGKILDEQTIAEGLTLQRELGVKWNRSDWDNFRINEASKREEEKRNEEEKARLQPVRMHSDKDTSVAKRIMKSTEGDSLDKRVIETRLEVAAEAQRLLEEQKKWEKQTEEVLGEVNPYL